MASFRVLYGDDSIAKNTKVSISTSGTYGRVIVNGKTVHQGSLNIGEVRTIVLRR